MEIKLNRIFIFILINILFLFSHSNQKELNNIIESYLNEDEIKTMEIDHFISGNVFDKSMNYYKINLLLNDSDKVYFDYQSEYGCLYVFFEEKNIYNSSKSDFIFCSEGINKIFELKQKDIMDKIDKTKINETYMYIGVGHNKSEINKKEYQYSMKVSYSKPDINIFEINSDHTILCKTEKYNETNICLFALVYNNSNSNNNIDISNEKNLIIYPKSQIESIKLNIYSDFMNKENYDEWNSNYLIKNIPNINSPYTNYDSQQEFLFINTTNEDKYIYICIESDKEVTIEMHSHYLYQKEEIKLPKMNEIQFYNIHPNQNKISFNFSSLKIYDINLDKDIIISLVTLNGKASIHFENDKSKKFITDTKENKLFLNLNNQNI